MTCLHIASNKSNNNDESIDDNEARATISWEAVEGMASCGTGKAVSRYHPLNKSPLVGRLDGKSGLC